MVPYLGFFYQARAKLYFRIHLLKKEEQNLQSWALLECWVRGWVRGKHFGIKIYTYYTVVEGIILTQEFFAIFFGPNFLFENSTTPFRVAATQCKKICPEGLNWPGRLAGISEGAKGHSGHSVSAQSSVYENKILLTKLFQASQSWHQLSDYENKVSKTDYTMNGL